MIRTTPPSALSQVIGRWADRAVFVLTPGLGAVNLIKSASLSGTPIVTALLASSIYGIGSKCNNGSQAYLVNGAGLGNNYTLFAIASITAGNTEHIIDNDNGSTRRFQLKYNAIGQIDFIPFSGGVPVTISVANYGTAIPTDDCLAGFPVCATAASTGAIAVWYRKAKVTGTLAGAPDTPTTVSIGARAGNSLFVTRGLFLACGWNRILGDDEIRALMDNPWQMFPAAPKKRFVGASAAAGGVFIPIVGYGPGPGLQLAGGRGLAGE